MSIAEVEDRTVAVVTLLRNGGRGVEAHDMARLAADLNNPQKVEDALENIITRCGIRWLGDLPLRNIGSSEWLQKLSALESAARAELLLSRNRSSRQNSSATKSKRPNTSRRTAPGNQKSPWGDGRSKSYNEKGRKTKPVGNRSTAASLRTLSAAARNMGGQNDRWMSNVPIERAATPIWHTILLFLPPFALIAYCVLVIVDSTPDLYPPESVLVEGVVERWELRENYSPSGVKGVIYLANHDAGYSVQEALGYGFADSIEYLQPGDAATMRVHAEALSAGNNRVAQIVDALANADTEGDYDIALSGTLPNDNAPPIPLLELSVSDNIQYSRLQLAAPAEQRIRNWGLLGLAAFVFMFLAGRLRAN